MGIFAISSRWDNEKVGTPANDDNNHDAGFNDGVVEFIYLPIPPRDSDPTPGLTGNKPPRPVGRGSGWDTATIIIETPLAGLSRADPSTDCSTRQNPLKI